MDAWFHKNFREGAVRRMPGNAARLRMPSDASEWIDFKERAFKALLIVAPLFVFLVILAWDWLPFNEPQAQVQISTETQHLMTLSEEEIRAVVWPNSAAQIEAEQPEFGGGGNPAGDAIKARFARCGGGSRVTCVVDGDTFWYQGEKVRVADIDAPEVTKPECSREAELGDRATDRLIALLNAAPFSLRAADGEFDQYGRRLLTVIRNGRSLGATLVAEGLAERWGGPRINWCSR
jgi:endonuclease YncB( thermonuclease family)